NGCTFSIACGRSETAVPRVLARPRGGWPVQWYPRPCNVRKPRAVEGFCAGEEEAGPEGRRALDHEGASERPGIGQEAWLLEREVYRGLRPIGTHKPQRWARCSPTAPINASINGSPAGSGIGSMRLCWARLSGWSR